MSIQKTKEWFVEAIPTPTVRNTTVQIAVHLEEVAEMLSAISGVDLPSEDMRQKLVAMLEEFSGHLKSGGGSVIVTDRKEFLDGLTDQVVTAVGCGHMTGVDVVEGLNRVNESNFSKFVNGKAVFDENGKIKKGPNYFKPDLQDLY